MHAFNQKNSSRIEYKTLQWLLTVKCFSFKALFILQIIGKCCDQKCILLLKNKPHPVRLYQYQIQHSKCHLTKRGILKKSLLLHTRAYVRQYRVQLDVVILKTSGLVITVRLLTLHQEGAGHLWSGTEQISDNNPGVESSPPAPEAARSKIWHLLVWWCCSQVL